MGLLLGRLLGLVLVRLVVGLVVLWVLRWRVLLGLVPFRLVVVWRGLLRVVGLVVVWRGLLLVPFRLVLVVGLLGWWGRRLSGCRLRLVVVRRLVVVGLLSRCLVVV